MLNDFSKAAASIGWVEARNPSQTMAYKKPNNL
jgi:hypothetical protein